MRQFLHSLLWIAAALMALLLLSPWLLYEWGLQQIEAVPSRPALTASAEQQDRVWPHARASGPQQVEKLNPYGYVWHMFELPRPAGERVAAWVARDHLLQRAGPRRHLTRQFAEAALMIWLTRHWTTEELVTAAVPGVDRDLAYRARRAMERAAEFQPPERSRAASAM